MTSKFAAWRLLCTRTSNEHNNRRDTYALGLEKAGRAPEVHLSSGVGVGVLSASTSTGWRVERSLPTHPVCFALIQQLALFGLAIASCMKPHVHDRAFSSGQMAIQIR